MKSGEKINNEVDILEFDEVDKGILTDAKNEAKYYDEVETVNDLLSLIEDLTYYLKDSRDRVYYLESNYTEPLSERLPDREEYMYIND